MNDNAPPRRIVVGAACLAEAERALRLASGMLEEGVEEISGLLVEEATRIGRLPAQRLITPTGLLRAAPSPEEMRARLTLEARAFERMLARTAGARRWRLERREGELIGCLMQARESWDLAVVGTREITPLRGRVALITPASGATPRALQEAAVLARALKTDALALSLGGSEGAPARGPIVEERFRSAAELLARLGRTRASAVILDLASGPLREETELRELMEAARCSVVFLG